jgi:hypothetical protein
MKSNSSDLQHTDSAASGVPDMETHADIKDVSPVGEVMDLAVQVNKAAAIVYEMIADVAICLQKPPSSGASDEDTGQDRVGALERQCQLNALLEIVEATESTENHLQLLNSRAISDRPEVLEVFLEESWRALETFREVCARLTEILRWDDLEIQRQRDLKTASD